MSRRRRRSKKWIYWLVMLILAVGALVMVYFVWDSYFREKKSDDVGIETETVEVQVNNEVIKDNEPEQTEKLVEKEPVVAYDGGDPNEDESLTGVVTYAGTVDETLMIRVNIDQFLSSGSCKLMLEKSGSVVYEDEANIIDSAATATCEGFNVPVTGFSSGNYKIIIKISAGDKSGTINGEANI